MSDDDDDDDDPTDESGHPSLKWDVPTLFPITQETIDTTEIYDADPRYISTQPHPRIIPHIEKYHNLRMIRFTENIPHGDDPPQTTTETPAFNLKERLTHLASKPGFFFKDVCFFSEDTDVRTWGPHYKLIESNADANRAETVEGRKIQSTHSYLKLVLNATKGGVSVERETMYDPGTNRHNPFITLEKPSEMVTSKRNPEDVALAYLHIVVERARIKLRHCIYHTASDFYISLDLLKILAMAGDLSTRLRIVTLTDADGSSNTATHLTHNTFFQQCIAYVDTTRDTLHQTIEISSPVSFTFGEKSYAADISTCRYVNASCISTYVYIQSCIGVELSRLQEISAQLSVDERALCVVHVVNAMVSELARSKAFAHGVRYTSNAFKVYHENHIRVAVSFVRELLSTHTAISSRSTKRPRKSMLPIS